jgi:hypothetical protein
MSIVVVSLADATIVDWPDLASAARIAFPALTVLGIVMVGFVLVGLPVPRLRSRGPGSRRSRAG